MKGLVELVGDFEQWLNRGEIDFVDDGEEHGFGVTLHMEETDPVGDKEETGPVVDREETDPLLD